MSQDFPRGRFIWHELLTRDPEGAISFYTDLVGWTTEVFGEGEEPYTMFAHDAGPLAGVMQLPQDAIDDGAPSNWLPYMASPDVDATVARAQELGAQVFVHPQDIPGAGRFAVLADPAGATFGTYRSADAPPGHDDLPQVKEFSWHELATTLPYEEAFEFYSDLFGWEKAEAMDMGEAGIYQMYKKAGSEIPLGGIFTKPEDMPVPAAWICYIRVPDAHAGAETVKELDGQVLNGPMEVPGGDFIVQCTDPQGAFFALHSSEH